MKRQCTIFRSSKDYGSGLNRHICIDLLNADELYFVLAMKGKKFENMARRILTLNNMYSDFYAKEKISDKTRNVTAMKFFDSDNTRIYCQELRTVNGLFYIICAALLLNKKVQKNDQRIDQLIKKIAGYEYEIT